MTGFEKAEVTLPSDSEVQVVRSFKAPAALVWRAFTEPALVTRWMLGPPGWTMPVCEMDVREGGAYRWRWHSEDGGQEFGFHGTFREVEPNVRTVHVEHFDQGSLEEGMGEGHSVVTTTYSETDGVTTVTMRMDFGSKANRDAAVATGMTDGMEMGHQRLDALLNEMA
jgi:uncharacterized protein YndB with AHSA1/START domain